MGRFARIVGATSIVAAPVLIGVADQLRMLTEPTGDAGAVSDLVLYQGAAWLACAGALVTIPAIAAIWSLSTDRSRVWAWVGLVLGALGAVGQVVHLVGYYALGLVFATDVDPAVGVKVSSALESQAFFLVLFIPFFFSLLAYIPQMVGLRRAKIVPLWAAIVVIAATLVFAVVGSTPFSSALWTVALAAGLAPAAYGMARARQDASLTAMVADRLDPAVV